ncbi:MAG: UDP-N-acetylglucosamine 2-epimerase, partial [Verrucomicrobiales bacterium]
RNLLNEGIHPRTIYLTGSPMREVLDYYRPFFLNSTVLENLKLEKEGYFLASIHRAENVDSGENLAALLSAFEQLYAEYQRPVIVSTHPRTRDRLRNLEGWSATGDIRLMEPFGFHDYINLQLNAACTLSDSGTISEEAAILGFPAITLRNSIERPEAMDTGNIVITGLNTEVILDAVKLAISSRLTVGSCQIPAEYEIRNTSERVVKIILGTAKLCHGWQ